MDVVAESESSSSSESLIDHSSDGSDSDDTPIFSVYRCTEDEVDEDSISAIFGQGRLLFSRTNSPAHWASLSDTVAVCAAPASLLPPTTSPLPGVQLTGGNKVVRFTGIESVHHCHLLDRHPHHDDNNHLHHQVSRCRSVPNLDEEKMRHSDEEIRKMRNAMLSLKRSREVFRQLGRQQRLALAAICLVYFSCFCAISVLSPFFHQVAVEHSISTSTYGLIFSIHPLVVFGTSPFIGHIIPTIGPKFMFVSGVFLSGACTLLFGTLEWVEDDDQFLVLCFAVRGLGALGASAFSTAGATFVANLFPDKISAVMGILETFIGLGFSIGPVIGGALYTLGGFQLPFYVLGGIMSLMLPFNLYVLPSPSAGQPEDDAVDGRNKEPKSKVWSLLKNPAVILVCLVVTVSSSAWSVLEPTLVIHMRDFDLSPLHLGLLFLLTSASYAFSSPFWGWLNDKYDHGSVMMIAGLSVTGLSLLLLGPSSFLPVIPNVLWLNIVALILLGIFDALAYLPTYHALLKYAEHDGWPAGLSTSSFIAGLWASMYSLGEVIGPSLGTLMVELYDFAMSMSAIGLMNLSVAVLLLFYRVVISLRKRRKMASPECNVTIRKVETVEILSDETRPLFIVQEDDVSSTTYGAFTSSLD